MGEGKGTVCVTGGTGFVASWLIMRLLERGYSVRTTVRPVAADTKRDLSFLTNLPGASKNLQIFQAELSDPDSFDAAIEGCTGVFHVAAPMDVDDREPEAVVTQRAISGMIGILKSCMKSKTVKRIVYTSSESAIMMSNKGGDVDLLDETSWSDVDHIRKVVKFAATYMIIKTATEKAALKFAEENGLDLVSIIPAFIVGPFICPKLPPSVRTLLALVLGNEEEYVALLNMSVVHVDDVVRAHIFLLESPDAKGRYICSADTITIQQLHKYFSTKYPEYPIPTLDSLQDTVKGDKHPGLTSKKLLDTGFKFKYGAEEILDGTIRCCKENSYIS